MAAVYDRLWKETFSQYTLFTLGSVLISYWTILIIYFSLNGQFHWISFSFLARTLPSALPFLSLSLSRIWPLANGEAGNFISKNTPLGIISFILAVRGFVNTYFKNFAPLYSKMFHEVDRKGLEFLPAPFQLVTFMISFALLCSIRVMWRHRQFDHYLMKERPTLLKLASTKVTVFAKTCGLFIAISYGVAIFERIVCRQPIFYSLYLIFFSHLHEGKIIPMKTSFWQFILDIPFHYHLLWAFLGVILVLSCIEIFIEYYLIRSFHLCQKGIKMNLDPTIIILEGLNSPIPSVRSQATSELLVLLKKEPLWRTALFSEFVGDVGASKLTCQRLISIIKEYKKSVDQVNHDMKLFTKHLIECTTSLKSSSITPSTTQSADKSIFSPRKKTLIERILNKLQVEVSAKMPSMEMSDSSDKSMPTFLETTNSRNKTVKSTTNSVSLSKRERYVIRLAELLSIMFGRNISYYFFRIICGFLVEYIKAKYVPDALRVQWALEALGSLVMHSYDEDTHGQVQFVMDDILASLIDLYTAANEFSQYPQYEGKALSEEYFKSSLSPSDSRVVLCGNMAISTLEAIFEKYSDSLTQVKLTPSTREKLKDFGYLSN